jgi:hypothetical protein
MHSQPRCQHVDDDGERCRAAMMSERARERWSKQFGGARIPLWCPLHVKQLARGSGFAVTFGFQEEGKRCKAMVRHGPGAGQRRSNAVMKGLALCVSHGGKGAKFGREAWRLVRTAEGGPCALSTASSARRSSAKL